MGVASIVLGVIGIILSYFYVGVFLCLPGIVLGAIDFFKGSSDGTYGILGILSSILGIVMAIFFIVSDLDSGILCLNKGNIEVAKWENSDDGNVKTEELHIEADNGKEDRSKQEEKTKEENIQEEKTGQISVDKNIFSVELTIPSDFTDSETTQQELDQISKEMGYKSVKLNPDGSITYKMTKEQHKELLEETRKSLNEALQEMISSEEYPTFVDIQANDDFTEFTVMTTSEELGITESMSIFVFYFYGGTYSAFSGKDVDNISVMYVNSNTGEIISEANSKDLGNDNSSD